MSKDDINKIDWEEIERWERDEFDMSSLPKRIKEFQHNIDNRINPECDWKPMTMKYMAKTKRAIESMKLRLKQLETKYGKRWEDEV